MKKRKEQALLLFSFLPLSEQKNSFVHYREERKRELGGNRQKSAGFYVWSVALLKTGAGVWNPYFE